MKSRDFKVLDEIEEVPYKFNSIAFKQEVKKYIQNQKKSGVKITAIQIQDLLADETNVSSDAIKNWLYGYNGPSELESVKKIADCMGIDYKRLLQRKKEEKVKTELKNNRNVYSTENTTKAIIRNIYQEMAMFVHEYRDEVGLAFIESEEEVDRFEEMYDNIMENIHRNMLDIPEETYNQLEGYVESTFGHWLHGIPCGIWETTEYDEYLDGREEKEWIMREYVEKITNEFYSDLRVILKNYIVEK